MAPTKGFMVFLLCASGALAGCDQLRPFEQVCEKRLGPGNVSVVAARSELRNDFTQTSAALNARGAQKAGQLVLGITEANLKSSVALGGAGVVKPFSGRYCTRPDVTVTLAYQPLTVYIAKEQAPGSCAHDLTLSHEMKHVRSYERFIGELAGQVEAEVKAVIGDGIHYFASTSEGERELATKVNARVKAVIDTGMQNAQQRQGTIDSPEEYGRLDLMQSKCG